MLDNDCNKMMDYIFRSIKHHILYNDIRWLHGDYRMWDIDRILR